MAKIISELQNRQRLLDDSNKDLSAKYDEISKKSEKAISELSTFKAESQQELDAKISETYSLTQELSQTKESLSKMQKDKAEFEKLNLDLKEKLTATENKFDDYEKQKEEFIKERDEHLKEVQELRNKILGLEQSKEKAEAERDAIKAENAKLSAEKDRLEQDKREAEKERDAIKAENKQLLQYKNLALKQGTIIEAYNKEIDSDVKSDVDSEIKDPSLDDRGKGATPDPKVNEMTNEELMALAARTME